MIIKVVLKVNNYNFQKIKKIVYIYNHNFKDWGKKSHL